MRLVGMAVAAVVGLGLLAGCSSGRTANETLPPSASSPAETSATLPPLGPPDLPMPDEAREQTAAGAEAFLRYYMDVYTAAQASMDPTYMDQLSHDCETCNRIIGEINTDASAGYTYQGGEVTVEYVDTTNPKDSVAEAVFSLYQAPLAVVGQDGQPLPDLTFGERKSPGCGAILGWDRGEHTWVINQWDIN